MTSSDQHKNDFSSTNTILESEKKSSTWFYGKLKNELNYIEITRILSTHKRKRLFKCNFSNSYPFTLQILATEISFSHLLKNTSQAFALALATGLILMRIIVV